MRRVAAVLLLLVAAGLAGDSTTAHVAVRDPRLLEVVLDARAALRRRLPDGQWTAAKRLWDAESHWNPRSRSGTCLGIPQACPGAKMRTAIRPRRGARWDSIRDPFVQVAWGEAYVHARYGTFRKALAHQEEFQWY